MAGLEACQKDQALAAALERLTESLAKAQGKLFVAAKTPPETATSIDGMRRAMEYLAQALKTLQDVQGGGDAVGLAAGSIARALKTLHPVVQTAKEEAVKRSIPPPQASAPARAAKPSKPAPAAEGATLSVNVNTVLNMNTDHQFYAGFSENIEEGGIFIATFDTKPINSKVLVNFKLPGGRPVTARGVVHWVREYNASVPDTPPGMGVRFTDLLSADKAAIEEYVKARAPMFYDDGK